MESPKYQIVLSPTAAAQLREMDGSVRKLIAKTLDKLTERPNDLGKPLADELKGYRSIRTAGRYRIIYRVSVGYQETPTTQGKVEVPCIGIRREGGKSDVYAVATKLLGGASQDA